MKEAGKLVVAAEVGSSNLGDPIIADCLRFLFKRSQPDLRMDVLDISGRGLASLRSAVWRPIAARVIEGSGALNVIRNILRWKVISRRCQPYWTAMLADADAVVIGGGQLLMDNGLDFPLKVNTIANLARSLGRTVHFVSCGVGRDWSHIAARLFRDALEGAGSISVRDSQSFARLEARVPGKKIVLSCDPAVWASDVYGRGSKIDADLIGLGIVDTIAVNAHSRLELSRNDLLEFWAGVARTLHNKGLAFELFTNGSRKDHDFAALTAQVIEARVSVPCRLAPRPKKAWELARRVSEYSGVIASRLHAHILAMSYLIPSVALVADDKVRAFFEDMGKGDLAFDAIDATKSRAVVEALCCTMHGKACEDALNRMRVLAIQNTQNVLRHGQWSRA